jgi:D-serine deaminase-like pyridoxal phosphate-dependent protein
MKVTKRQLRRIIKEEKRRLLREMAATEEQISELAYEVAGVDGEREDFAAELKIQLEIDLETHKMAQKAWEEAEEWAAE